VTFYAWLLALSFPIILFSCSPPQVKGVNRFPWLMVQTMRFHPRKCLFGVSLKKFDLTGSVTPNNHQKVGVVNDFPAKLENSIKTHISVKYRDIDTKFETQVATKKYTLDFGSNVTYHRIQDGGSHHYEKIQTVITQSIFVRFQ
jgi:hypothetical protein